MNKRIENAVKTATATAEKMVAKLDRPTLVRVMEGQKSVIRQHETLVGPQGQNLSPASPFIRERDTACARATIAVLEIAIGE